LVDEVGQGLYPVNCTFQIAFSQNELHHVVVNLRIFQVQDVPYGVWIGVCRHGISGGRKTKSDYSSKQKGHSLGFAINLA
jgi:hypothetical protein